MMKILVAFRKKTNRVKCAVFHPRRPWILVSLHSGKIQLYDYRHKVLLEEFEEHEGAVRGVDFHSKEPLFCSGGDDGVVKVWNYSVKKCLFSLEGHSDYIRTVQFHKTLPWIVSCADDMTVRIWHWEARTCLTTITGHHHYVMCARFHPTKDLLVTASLDQEVRVWDISALRTKRPKPQRFLDVRRVTQEILGNTDVETIHLMTGHTRGVNWADFSPTENFVVSGADDQTVRLWRYDDQGTVMTDSFVGHTHNVSCVVFQAASNMIVSNGEDRCIRFWRQGKGTLIGSCRESESRFWSLASHPTNTLLCAGHDNGFLVFKVDRERPPFSVTAGSLAYVRGKVLLERSISSGKETPLARIPKGPKGGTLVDLTYNPLIKAVLCKWRVRGKGDTHTVYLLPDTPDGTLLRVYDKLGTHACFVGSHRFAHRERNDRIVVRSVRQTKRVVFEPVPTIGQVVAIFEGPAGCMLIQTSTAIHLFDIEQNNFVQELAVRGTRRVVWSDSKRHVALLSKLSVTLADSTLTQLCEVTELTNVKAAAFDGDDVLVYTTLTHLKYLLSNGDVGVIKTIHEPFYPAKVVGDHLFSLTRKNRAERCPLDNTEYRFKFALLQNDQRGIRRILSQAKVMGDSMVSYLYKKGHPKIALRFVQDDTTRFNLAIECGDIKVAKRAALELDRPECWERLAGEAIKQGDHQTVEMAYQRTKSYEKLAFLYFITGQSHLLTRMLSLANERDDANARFQVSLLSGDVRERIRLLSDVGQHNLAYITAITHGLPEVSAQLASAADPEVVAKSDSYPRRVVAPPRPLLVQSNWPLLYTEATDEIEEEGEIEDLGDVSGWGGGISLGGEEEGEIGVGPTPSMMSMSMGGIDPDDPLGMDGGMGGWGGGIDVQEDELREAMIEASEAHFVAPTMGHAMEAHWLQNSRRVGHLIAAGSFGKAMKSLNQEFGIVAFRPLKRYFLDLFRSCRAHVPTPLLPMSIQPIQMETGVAFDEDATLPTLEGLPSMTSLQDLLDSTALRQVTGGRFTEAKETFLEILHGLLFVDETKRGGARRFEDLVRSCTEYLTGLRLEEERVKIERTDPKKSMELAAYFSRCRLKATHVKLTVFKAMTIAYMAKNFQTASDFAQRLLDLRPMARHEKQAHFVLKRARSQGSNAFPDLEYDPRNPFVICTVSLTPIYAGSESVKCGYCHAHARPQNVGEMCLICGLATYRPQ